MVWCARKSYGMYYASGAPRRDRGRDRDRGRSARGMEAAEAAATAAATAGDTDGGGLRARSIMRERRSERRKKKERRESKKEEEGGKRCISSQKCGPHRESNPGPLAPEARIIPLDHVAAAKQLCRHFSHPPPQPHKYAHTPQHTTTQQHTHNIQQQHKPIH